MADLVVYRNGDINSCSSSYMDTLEKAKLTASICHIAGFLKPGILIYNSKVLDTARRLIPRAIPKRFAFHANAINEHHRYFL